jgi:hypothetical protein
MRRPRILVACRPVIVLPMVTLAIIVLRPSPVTSAAAMRSAAMPCERLTALLPPNATITFAGMVTPGAFSPPCGNPETNLIGSPPAFCRVAAAVKPSSDSALRVEVWTPASGWNDKFEGVGNAGWASAICYSELAEAVAAGCASASTDAGTKATRNRSGSATPRNPQNTPTARFMR